MAAQRNTYYATIVYPESAPTDWLDKLEEEHIQALVSPIHDKDIEKDGKEKKPHYHVILMFESLKSMKQVKEITDKFGGVGTLPLHSLGGYSRYLCHLDNSEKAQYNPEDVKEISGANYKECCRCNDSQEKEDEAIELIFKNLEERMKTIVGTKVNINRKDRSKGKIEIEYYSEAELERIVELIETIG